MKPTADYKEETQAEKAQAVPEHAKSAEPNIAGHESSETTSAEKASVIDPEKKTAAPAEPAGVAGTVPCARCKMARCPSVPSYVWVSLAVLVVAEVLAVTGSIYYARNVHNEARRAAGDVARTAARSVETALEHVVAPMYSLANLVTVQPHWPTANATFPAFAESIYKTQAFYQIELCPYGVVGSMSMPWLNLTGEELWKVMLWFDFGLNIIRPTSPYLAVEFGSIMSNGSVALLGPWYADGELSEGAFVARYSIFLPKEGSEKWEMPNNTIEVCPHDVCNTPDGKTWWGWSNAVFAWKTIKPKLQVLDDRGLHYTLAPDPRAANQSFLATSSTLPDPTTCEVVRMEVYGWLWWTFCVEPPGGFGPSWRTGLLVGVTALSVLLAVLVGLVLRSRHQAMAYLTRQLELNRQLAVAKEEAVEGRRVIEAEKQVMDALLQRQRNLIELFGKEEELMASVADAGASEEGAMAAAKRRLIGASSGTSVSGLSRESATMDRIEAVRRQLSANRSPSVKNAMANDVKLMDMLGEGTFGKVYRGVWRGTDVAVKTMVLPANMSGAEKREKMAIMEAAIASSLAHPNIVQTYTYFIKTVREEASSDSGLSPADGILLGGSEVGSAASTVTNKAFDEPASNNSRSASSQAVHGYEVRLVLEFCDRGCLRDALDGNAFLTSDGVNYRGTLRTHRTLGMMGPSLYCVLDTAADIAKAMLHLHLADVLHGDLKARNVMLKSSGTEGRGVVCKVADFGLAVKMDTVEQTHMSGMYQGTLTHMAPELMLHGRMSKAADVYAFGITLWELFTGGHPFQSVPRALIGHQITQERKRPAFPPFAPAAYTRLTEECWAHRPEDRPSFEAILERLTAMRQELSGAAAPLAAYTVGGTAPPPLAPQPQPVLPKLDGADPQMVASNPIFEPSSTGGPGIKMGGSWSGSGSSINWQFARSGGLRAPLPIVEEDDREHDVSSKKLPSLRHPTPHHISLHHQSHHGNHHGDGHTPAEADARGEAQLDSSGNRLPVIEEGA
ncbi:hypothetical protein GPECTOR_32g506 [Gonium pectorale]|uniref:Protein kinase domain-containing protein n=1 Tax=Gonium pectorale TaxID=33097 RepID=A0A150GDP2_GONPE|nr:hypothetical protein GPECTOR_32g506 [Gonium pectorale]|eukprot:KXZ47893.1 hypothetical protein GPECTOR_32g506 [Gonium pectorale]